MTENLKYQWSSGDAYERYMGRWSRAVAAEFVAWLALPAGARCFDVGCGTGALSATLLAAGAGELFGIDRSHGFLTTANARVGASNARFAVGNAQALPVRDGRFDAAASALVLNFVPHPERMLAEMMRVVRPAGVVGVYVWDYAGGMQLIRSFWDAAVSLDPAAAALVEALKFSICTHAALGEAFQSAGFQEVEVRAIDVPAVFRNFEDYWEPFLSGQGPAPGYCVSLPEDRRVALREKLRQTLPVALDGTIPLTIRAWAARGARPR